MARKSWLVGPTVAALASIALISFGSNASESQHPLNLERHCRCFPGDACWPSEADWAGFNATVGGRLIATVPIADVCHENGINGYDAEACEQLRSLWAKPETHFSSSSSTMAPFVSNQSCSPWTEAGMECTMGRYVHYAVDASSASDYQKTLAFASEHDIRLVIRNTGHDYYGKSTGAGGLAIWTHNLKDINFLDYNSPNYKGKAIKVGAGVQVSEAQAAAHAQGLVVVGGICDSVGYAGGYSQGGGHGLLASKFGLAADQVLEWEVVTADGQHLVVTPTQHADLYWALSGGGGGTYAAVLSMTSKAHPDLKVSVANITFTNADVSQDVFFDAISTFLQELPAMVDAGTVPNWMYTDSFFALIPIMAPGLSKTELDDLFKPLFAKLDSSNIAYQYASHEFSNFLDGYSAYNPAYDVIEFSTGGRMIPRSMLESESKTALLTTALRRMSENGGIVSGVTFNVAKFGDESTNAANPVWRDSIFHAVVGTPWNFTDYDASIAGQRRVTYEYLPLLEKLTPGGGAYLNEGDPNQPDWQQAFYGSNYAKLNEIKNKYDPEHIFYGPTTVGSEYWEEKSDGRLCKAT